MLAVGDKLADLYNPFPHLHCKYRDKEIIPKKKYFLLEQGMDIL